MSSVRQVETAPPDLTFFSPPGAAADWRLILLCDAAASSGVLDNLPGTAEDVAGRTALDPHALRVMLDALVTLDVVEPGPEGSYALGPGAPDPEAISKIRHHARALRRWAVAIEPRLRGESGGDPAGMADPELFHDSLAATARTLAPEVIDACLSRFPNAGSVLDLGGLHGEYALEFSRRGLRATMQDQPAMVDVARRRGRLETAGVDLFEGSFFETLPEGPFDMVFCSGITHTFDGNRNLALFRSLHEVVAPSGGIAVVTFLRGRNPLTALFAVQMLLNGDGGDTHTEAEYREWLGVAGFTVDQAVVDLPGREARSVLFAI